MGLEIVQLVLLAYIFAHSICYNLFHIIIQQYYNNIMTFYNIIQHHVTRRDFQRRFLSRYFTATKFC